MANHGAGTKYVSVNLNKSYGQQQSNHHYNHFNNLSRHGSNRVRAGGGGGGGGGGGMVVLSRPRSSQKVGPKLSVPPPLNLPSLRKEHERIDSLGSNALSAGGISGTGVRPSSSGMGWPKPAVTVALQEKERPGGDIATDGVDGASKVSNGVYMPPVARSGVMESPGPGFDREFPPVEKAAILKGEDFPSLRATLPVMSGHGQKQKEDVNLKHKQVAVEELSEERRDASRLSSSLVHMRPQSQSAHTHILNGSSEGTGLLDDLPSSKQGRKQEENVPGLLPLVHLNPRSDWADDERDTRHGLRDRDRNFRYSKNEAFWDRDFDMPRASLLPHKPAAHSHFDRLGQHESETLKLSSGEAGPQSGGWQANTWIAASPLQKEVGNSRNGAGARPSSRGREATKENNYIPSPFRENVRDHIGMRDVSHQHGGRQPWNNNAAGFSSNRAVFTRDCYDNEQQNRDKHPFSMGEKPYFEDPFGDASFDVRDPFPVLGVVKKKKEAHRQTDFHDPVRESFEAELERVQKMQEEERRRIIEEQERAMELARREEEERMRLAREHEERQRRLEEEAREAVWRAEQERLEAVRRAEELRKAKEEEKNRILMEEERRKYAAKQKLLELEERIAKRQAEAAKGGSSASTFSDEKGFGMVKEMEVSRIVDTVDWEDGERMVDRITTSAPLDPSLPNRSYEMNSGPQFPTDGPLKLLDSGKPASSWRKDSFGNGCNSMFISQDMENVPRSPQHDGGRGLSKNEFFGTAGYVPSGSYYKAGMLEPHMNELSNPKGQRWNVPGHGDHYGRKNEMESEYQEGLGERYGELGWDQGQGFSRRNFYAPYPEKLYQNTVGDDYYPFGRPRYSVRQPRVLPPPSLASIQKTSYRADADRPGPSTFMENAMKYNHTDGIESTAQEGYGGDYQDNFGQPGIIRNEEQPLDTKPAPGCDSQSSLSVSSPPDSPIHLSHDDLDESDDSSVLSGTGKGKDAALLENDKEPIVSAGENNATDAGSVSSEDDEEWTLDNNEQMQEQEEYDEDEDGYQEEDEIHDADEENLDLTPEFGEMHIQDKDSNLVLGFNEGVEVEMPSDDFEKCHKNEEPTFTMPQHFVDSIEGQGSSDMISGNGLTIQPVEVPAQSNVDDSSRIFQETGNAMQNLAIQSNNALQASAVSEIVDKGNPLSDSGVSNQTSILPSLHVRPQLSSVQSMMVTSSATPGHTEEPVKLQFGLFSGPSLIPSPVPAIQIGSIQMPLPLHPQVGPSLTHMQPSQPPIFQLGQLRYTSPISQGVLPLTSQSFAQPSASSSFTLNKNPIAPAPVQLGRGDSAINLVTTASPPPSGAQASVVMRSVDLTNWNTLDSVSALPARERTQSVMFQERQSESASQEEGQRKTGSTERSKAQLQVGASAPLLVSTDKDMSGSKTEDQAYAGRGEGDVFSVRNSSARNLDNLEISHADASGYRRPRRHRTEFRVRASNRISAGDNLNVSGRIPANSMGNGARNIGVLNKSAKQAVELDDLRSGPATSQKIDSQNRSEIRAGKETVAESRNISNSGQTNLKRNLISQEDIDVPLQSGIVRVFEQPGIEAPSDDDDFIEVRSKRQMLNDRREQREREIRAKSLETKVTRKPRFTVQNNVAAARSNKTSAVGVVNNKTSDCVINKLQLAPIGTPAQKVDAQSDPKSQPVKSIQASPLPVVSKRGQNLASNFIFESENKVSDNIKSPLGSWSNSQIDQPVMALTQSQLDEAMKPASINSCASVEDHTDSISEPKVAASSVLAKDESFSSVANSVDSLLAGGKIQFGAVTASTVLLPSNRAASHQIGPPVPCRVDLQASADLTSRKDCSLFFQKEKHLNGPSAHMEDCEAEAEAAASAVAVAAMTSDEIGGNALGAGSVSIEETKCFGDMEIHVTAKTGMVGEQSNQSKVEESLSVSLPADLSVDTPPISLWPPLSSPLNSNQMITHFPSGPPHFPFYEMNPMLRAPVFAFGPHDESGSNKPQPQKVTGAVSGPPGTWQQGHPGVDSFYGPPTGFAGPFISPSGGVPGVQGPPHMVVYNHFAPVGQFGQVGLSFMSTTYIPSGKQPDWKHNSVSSPMIGGDGDVNNLNMASTQHNPTLVPASVQHLGPGSALLPMPSPLAMFDGPPFQSSPDMSVQAHWPHITPSPLQPAPPSMPLQLQPEGTLSSQFNNMPSIDQSSAANRFHDIRTPTPSDTARNFPIVTDSTVTRLPDELGLADASEQSSVVTKTSSNSTTETSKTRPSENTSSTFKPQSSQQKNVSSFGYYNHHRGSQRSKEWHQHRRSGFHGRNQSMGGEKGVPTTRVKQIYVAKHTLSSTSTTTTPS